MCLSDHIYQMPTIGQFRVSVSGRVPDRHTYGMTGDKHVLDVLVRVSRWLIPNGAGPACGGWGVGWLGAALGVVGRVLALGGMGDMGDMGDILQGDRYALLTIGVVGKSEVTAHGLLSELVLIHPTLPHRFFTFFYGVSTSPSHRATHYSGILRGVSPEGSRNIRFGKGGSGRVTSPLRPDSTGVGFLFVHTFVPPRSRVAKESLEELGRPLRVPAPECWYFGKQSVAAAN